MSDNKEFPGLGKDNVVHIGAAKDTLSSLPTAPAYLSTDAKIYYKKMGKYLIDIDRLKKTYLNALEVFANAMAQYKYAVEEINRKNQLDLGAGYVQTFKSGAANITAEVTLRNNAEKTLFQCFKLFGLDPLSDKGLKAAPATGQFDLFTQFLNGTN